MSAKELGTIEAWDAFLNNYPTGFRADLARAYVRRLGTEAATSPAPGPAPATSAPPQPAARPAVTPAPPTLQLVHRGPGASPWRNGSYSMDEGNASAYAASAESAGLELTTYCNASQKLSFVLGEKRRGVYPRFDQRIEQGLNASRGRYGTPDTMVSVRFSNGSEEIVSGHVMGLTGEVAIGATQDGQGFHPRGSFATNLMAEQSMTISAAPFSATFQLTGSRLAICNVLKRCGVSIGGCARLDPAPAPVSTVAPAAKKPVAQQGCPKGAVFLEGQCVPRSQVASFCGPGYKRRGSNCVHQSTLPQQQRQTQPQQGKCPPGKVWEIDRCVEDD